MVNKLSPNIAILGVLGVAVLYYFSRAFNRVDKAVNEATKPIAKALVDLTHDGVTFSNAGFVFYPDDFTADYALRKSHHWEAISGAHSEHPKMLAELFDYNRRLKPKYRHLIGTVIITPAVLWG